MAEYDGSRTKARLDFTLQMFVKEEIEKLELKLEQTKEKALKNAMTLLAIAGVSMTGLVYNLISDHLHLNIVKEKQVILAKEVVALEKRLLRLEVATQVRLDKVVE